MNKKIISIEDLAAMIEAGFRMVDKHFDRIDVRLDKLEAENKRIRTDLAETDTRTAVIALQLRVSKLEGNV